MTDVTPHLPEPALSQSGAHMNTRVLWCPSRYVSQHFGTDALSSIAASAGLEPAELDDSSRWISMRQVATFFDGVRALLVDDDEFRRACVHDMKEAYGALRFVLLASSPAAVAKLAARTVRLVSSVSTFEVTHDSPNCVGFRYHSTVPEQETRLVCLSRQAQSGAVPVFFGLPPAVVRETKCIAYGDDCCEYEYLFYTRTRLLPPLVGAVIGLLVAWAVAFAGLASLPGTVVLPILFGLVGVLIEMSRAHRGNLKHAEELRSAMEKLAEHEAEARRETAGLHGREKEWTKLMEEQVAERTAALEVVLARLRNLGEVRALNLRGFSHDLRNPLTVLRSNQTYLRDVLPADDDIAEVLEDNDNAVDRMEAMLRELVDQTSKDRALVKLNPEEIEVAPLVDVLRRRTRALVFGRPIRVSAFVTREAPERMVTDRLVFERVMDNLCTNAAKYTESGSIVLELDGSPGFLVVKISDTGCGISDDRIEQIFRGAGPDARKKESMGVGLSVVVQLLGQIGGRIEVMSKPGQGSTFWAYFPQQLEASPPLRRVASEAPSQRASNVVTIRRLSA